MTSSLQIVQAALPVALSHWPEQLLVMPPSEATVLLVHLYKTWVPGELTVFLQRHSPTKSLYQIDREIAAILLLLPEGLFECEALPLEYDRLPDEEAVRRWCWAPQWCLMQDEDLLLMEQEAILLEEAHAGCPKQEWARYIVEHAVRDRAYASLWTSSYLAYASALSGLVGLAARNEARDLAAYLERLQRYATPREVTREEATQRTLDLRRCHPNPHLTPEILEQREHWVIQFDKVGSPLGRLLIHQKTGAMHAEEFTLKRRR
jgi:hypothetical protein